MRIGITPRFENSIHGELWYAFESNLFEFIEKSMCKHEVLLLNPEVDIDIKSIDLLILGGGATPGVNPLRDTYETGLYTEAIENHIKIIGICRGAQLIAILNNARLTKVDNHINAVRKLELNSGEYLWTKCFHEWGITELDQNWDILAIDERDRSVEIYMHKNLEIICFLSHPERYMDGLNFDQMLDFLNK